MGLLTGTSLEPLCPDCQQRESQCTCPAAVRAARRRLPPQQQTARVSLEKRKKGKWMTIVAGLNAEASDLPALLARLKQSLGAGGSLDADEIQIQGDQRERVTALLKDLGYKTRG